MSALADRFRREGMADAVVLLVLSRTHPTTTAEEWGSILGLAQHEVRAAIERLRAKHSPAPARKRGPYRNAGRPMPSLAERRARDARVRQLQAEGQSLDAIAAAVDLSVSRVRQILAKATA